uniref:legumain n=1 Tax=Syphacia muris TaxID=451379 RepID=A0A0N5ASI8_9BILA
MLFHRRPHPKIWALLVAGSNGWSNYRHQADVCHAYHVVRSHGIPKEQIVTMLYDDIAYSKQNPYPGKIFNKPGGSDVYKGVQIDYWGDAVTPENFMAILQGNKSAILGGNGRVLNSTKDDHIFVFFSDHGAVGLVSFPDEVLTVEDLSKTLQKMKKRDLFNQMVFYLEACESGSMFNGILNKTTNIYAVTAANEHESSWAMYCDNGLKLPCLGDEFSVNWMKDSEVEDLRKETLQKQFDLVRDKTNLSHVMKYGDMKILREHVAEFQGWAKLADRNTTKSSTNYLDNFMITAVENLVHDEEKERWILNNHPHSVTKLHCHNGVVKWFHRHCFHFSRVSLSIIVTFLSSHFCLTSDSVIYNA